MLILKLTRSVFSQRSTIGSLEAYVDGVKVFLNPEHAVKLKDSVIDWVDDLMGSGFKIENPQAKRPCGCGESVDF